MSERKWTLDWQGQTILVLTTLLILTFVLHRLDESGRQGPVPAEHVQKAMDFLFENTDTNTAVKNSH